MKKAQSQIITTVLIILLVLAAIVIVWTVVQNLVVNVRDVDPEAMCIQSQFEIASARGNSDPRAHSNDATITIKRGPDSVDGNFSLHLMVDDSLNVTNLIPSSQSLEPLNSREFGVNFNVGQEVTIILSVPAADNYMCEPKDTYRVTEAV
jgi:hypothetical protein